MTKSHILVDTLEADEEDPFSLESYENLIHLHQKEKKDFIIARVTTKDDDGKIYHSYYSAFHINKVLFRAEPGLLHRMVAKNPLNNMEIIGDVHYYRIEAKNIPYDNNRTPTTASPVRSLLSASPQTPNSIKSPMLKMLEFTGMNEQKKRLQIYRKDDFQVRTTQKIRMKENKKDQIKGVDSTPSPGELFCYEAYFFGTDDDFLV